MSLWDSSIHLLRVESPGFFRAPAGSDPALHKKEKYVPKVGKGLKRVAREGASHKSLLEGVGVGTATAGGGLATFPLY